MLAIQKNNQTFSYNGTNYTLMRRRARTSTPSLPAASSIGIAYKDVVSSSTEGQALSFEFVYAALKSHAALEQQVEDEAVQETAGASEATGATDDAPIEHRRARRA